MNLESMKITYMVLKVGGKVNGMKPPMWLLLRSLLCETQSFVRILLSSENTIVTKLLIKSYVFPINQNKSVSEKQGATCTIILKLTLTCL
jgi:hypothetical protein